MRLRKRYVPLAAALGAAAVVLPAIASSETGPTIEAFNAGLYSHYWSPSQASVAAGGVVAFRNATAVAHGVEWVGGPGKPECSSGVPVGNTATASGKEWSGTCTFAQAGTYTFYCTVHGPEMTGTITVSANGTATVTTPTPTPVPTTPTAPLPAPPVETPAALPPIAGPSLGASQHGDAVRGSLEIAKSGAGGRLEIDLLAKGAALGKAGRSTRVRVGGLVRSSVAAGRTSFALKLDARARRALERRGRLALIVKFTLTPVHGKSFTVTRAIVEHA